jgi:hypothetical protein
MKEQQPKDKNKAVSATKDVRVVDCSKMTTAELMAAVLSAGAGTNRGDQGGTK